MVQLAVYCIPEHPAHQWTAAEAAQKQLQYISVMIFIQW